MKIIETNTLYLRQLQVEDAEHFYQLNLDAEVLKYTGDVPFSNVETARSFLKNYDQYRKYRTGRMAVIRKKDNAFLGWCGLKYDAETDEYDIGFRFFRKYWNHGYATEAALACIQYGFKQLPIKTIIGRAMFANQASIKVLEKIGLIFHHSYNFDGHEGAIYKIDNPETFK